MPWVQGASIKSESELSFYSSMTQLWLTNSYGMLIFCSAPYNSSYLWILTQLRVLIYVYTSICILDFFFSLVSSILHTSACSEILLVAKCNLLIFQVDALFTSEEGPRRGLVWAKILTMSNCKEWRSACCTGVLPCIRKRWQH